MYMKIKESQDTQNIENFWRNRGTLYKRTTRVTYYRCECWNVFRVRIKGVERGGCCVFHYLDDINKKGQTKTAKSPHTSAPHKIMKEYANRVTTLCLRRCSYHIHESSQFEWGIRLTLKKDTLKYKFKNC